MPPFDLPTGTPGEPETPPPSIVPRRLPPVIEPCPLCDVRIFDKNNVPITSTQTVRVGEKIVLSARFRGPCAVGSPEWSIPGVIVKDYEEVRSAGVDLTSDISQPIVAARVIPITDADRHSFRIEFHWVDGGDGRNVRFSCESSHGTQTSTASVSATFNVKAPTLDNFSSSTGQIGVENKEGKDSIVFGINNKPGILWTWKVTLPAGIAGAIKDVQTVRQMRKRTNNGKKQVFTIPGTKVPPPRDQLDDRNPYTPGNVQPGQGGAPISSESLSLDSPASPIVPGDTEKSAHDTFKYYVMYMSNEPGAIWVPIGVMDWYWSYTATLQGSTWTLGSQAHSPDQDGHPTTTFPEYDSNASKNDWFDE